EGISPTMDRAALHERARRVRSQRHACDRVVVAAEIDPTRRADRSRRTAADLPALIVTPAPERVIVENHTRVIGGAVSQRDHAGTERFATNRLSARTARAGLARRRLLLRRRSIDDLRAFVGAVALPIMIQRDQRAATTERSQNRRGEGYAHPIRIRLLAH